MSRPNAIDSWLSSYVRAWRSDARRDVGSLFTADARYFTAPYRPPLVGAAAIAAWWIEQAESRMRWTFDCEVVASNGDLHVVRGKTTYPDTPGPNGRPEVYHNIWLVTLRDDGAAREFVEYWMLEE